MVCSCFSSLFSVRVARSSSVSVRLAVRVPRPRSASSEALGRELLLAFAASSSEDAKNPLVAFSTVGRNVVRRSATCVVSQSAPSGNPRQCVGDLAVLFGQVCKLNAYYQLAVATWSAGLTGAVVSHAPIKRRDRAIEKLWRSYRGDARFCIDLVRASITFQSFDAITECVLAKLTDARAVVEVGVVAGEAVHRLEQLRLGRRRQRVVNVERLAALGELQHVPVGARALHELQRQRRLRRGEQCTGPFFRKYVPDHQTEGRNPENRRNGKRGRHRFSPSELKGFPSGEGIKHRPRR